MQLTNVSVRGVSAVAEGGVLLIGAPDSPIQGLELSNISIKLVQVGSKFVFWCGVPRAKQFSWLPIRKAALTGCPDCPGNATGLMTNQ